MKKCNTCAHTVTDPHRRVNRVAADKRGGHFGRFCASSLFSFTGMFRAN